MDGIKYIFYGYKPISSLSDLIARADLVAKDHRETSDLLEKVSVKEILKECIVLV